MLQPLLICDPWIKVPCTLKLGHMFSEGQIVYSENQK